MMRMIQLIHKKRQGEQLSAEEINYIIEHFTNGNIPDYQMSAFLMAIYFRGMSDLETAQLTMAMVRSGEAVDLSQIAGIKVDKHSTGGVGDKLSLIIAPLVASVGIPVAKMAGRGLGHTGGTIDKLQSIPGFKVEMPKEMFIDHVNKYKIAIVSQSGNLTPADKLIYALRDVTDTVDSIPLIASSIMSKKIASGADCIVLDVKVGSGAFMKSLEDATVLARTMVDIGNHLQRKTVAIITDMSQPLGHEVGNANEVNEACQVLQGGGPEDLRLISLTIASHMAVLGGGYASFENAYQSLSSKLATGQAWTLFKQFVAAQGGNLHVLEHPRLLPQAQFHLPVIAAVSGYMATIDAETVGRAAMITGAGRMNKSDSIDYAAGITVVKKIGDKVTSGDTVFIIHSNLSDNTQAQLMLAECYTIAANKPTPPIYIQGIVQ